MTLESDIERPASEYAKLRRWFVDKIMRTSENAFPDRFHARRIPKCPHCGNETKVLLIEYKAPDERPTAQQLLRHKQLRDVGLQVEVVDDLEDAKRLLR